MQTMLWDIFCRVIDNFGDIGVCWRLCADLTARGNRVRLWVDDGSALQWMAPGALEGQWPSVQVLPWAQSSDEVTLRTLPLADAWIEAFGCEIPQAFVAHYVQQVQQQPGPWQAAALPESAQPIWLNLEYLSAEPYVERCHALPSPVLRGPAQGWSKTFFYPGFSAKTGGLLREPSVPRLWQAPDAAQRAAFFAQHQVPWQGETVLSLFCYEPPLLQDLLDQLAASATPSTLLATAGRASCAVQSLLGADTQKGALQVCYLPLLTQTDYDYLLASCDLNFVRGEDSVLRALWAGQPFVWHIYPQEDLAHGPKLEAFMDTLQLGAPVRTLHRAWNGLLPAAAQASALAAMQPAALAPWQREVLAARARLCELDDLCSQLIQCVRNKQ
jgi:uncharacterized repeat protein (TIGR03837 family)